MKFPFGKAESKDKADRVPLEIYGSLVDALHETALSPFIGSIATTIAAFITAWWAQSLILLICGVALAAATVLRAADMRTYQRLRPTLRSEDALRSWERRYIINAALYVGLMGLWCLACWIVSEDPFVRLFGFAGVVAFMTGVFGRNFASNPLVTTQMLVGGIPLVASLAYAGGPYYSILILLVIPFLASIKLISDRLRGQLLDAVISERDITQLAARFTTALNNMPQGLIMFDGDNRLLVANERLIELLGIRRDAMLAGKSPTELWTSATVIDDDGDIGKFAKEFEQRLKDGRGGDTLVEISGDRWLSLTTRPMDNGGSVVIVEDVTERRIADQRVHRLARFDTLTKLPNRHSFHESVADALELRDGTDELAVLFVDLDEFKQVNDTLGHPAGDALLSAVADRLRFIVAAPNVVARFGGDEFVVLHHILDGSEAEAEELAHQVLLALSRPYQIEGHDLLIGASIGIAVSVADTADPDLLLKNADMALYNAKAHGRGGARLFDPSMDEAVQAKRALEQDLRQALAGNQFELYYQPLVSMRTRHVTTCEALLRWKHPVRGMVPPSVFIPVAEDIGIIKEIGDWVIRNAAAECATWPSSVRVAVNLSSVQFRNDHLTEVVADALRHSRLPPNRLEVEITESVLLRDTPGVRAILDRFVEMGVRIALDDFGTGYSGLSYLHTFPLNKVKVDRSFVSQLQSSDRSLTLLKGVARLSAALGLSVVVEGVETAEQLAIIASEDAVDEVQGYFFSVPLPVDQIRQFIASHASGSGQDLTGSSAAGKKRRIEAA